MISFYSDENLPQDLIDALRYLGYDVLTSSEARQANQSISDAEIFKFAHAQKRVLITLNREDFISLHRQS